MFRAQAALDLRRRDEEDAKRALGFARQAVAAAASAVAAAEAELAGGLRRARDERQHATDTLMSGWLRNWVAGQRRQVATLQQDLARRRDDERQAASHLLDATRRVRMLVQLRERLLQEFERQELRAEQREMNWIGSLRHYASRQSSEYRIARPDIPDRGEEVKACQ
jgi:flagellar export protein FliJ